MLYTCLLTSEPINMLYTCLLTMQAIILKLEIMPWAFSKRNILHYKTCITIKYIL